MKKIAAILAVLLAFAAPAVAQPFTKSTLNSQVSQQFPDQFTGAITPATTRTFLNNQIASFQQAPTVNPQVGTTYTFQVADYGLLVTFSNASSVAVSLPQATGSFATWNVYAKNVGTNTVTITPTTSTIGGAASLALAPGQVARIISDGTNYQAWAIVTPAQIVISLRGVDLTSSTTDHPIPIALPIGVTNYGINTVRLANASGDISTGTIGVFTGTGGTGQTIAANQAITISTASVNTNGTAQSLTLTNGGTESYNLATLQIRVGTGVAKTVDVFIAIVPY